MLIMGGRFPAACLFDGFLPWSSIFSTLAREALKLPTSSCDLLYGMEELSPGFGAGVVLVDVVVES